MFKNRSDAARRLSTQLDVYRGKHPLVLAIPRGAAPMAKIIAEALGGDLDVVLVKKLRAPHSLEFAIGAIDESGAAYIADYAAEAGATPAYIAHEQQTQMAALQRRRAQYTPVRPPLDPTGRIVIVVDDGLATGATMIAALHAVRTQHPARLICAVPVASPEAAEKVRAYADEVVCLETPVNFRAVGEYYADFPQIEDQEVIEVLGQRGEVGRDKK